jgi:hypothetical protein
VDYKTILDGNGEGPTTSRANELARQAREHAARLKAGLINSAAGLAAIPAVKTETAYIDELGATVPSRVLLGMDIEYVRALAKLLKERDEVAVSQHALIKSLRLENGRRQVLLNQAEDALKDLCRDEAVLGSLPASIQNAVKKVGNELLVKEYAEAFKSVEPDWSGFDLAEEPVPVRSTAEVQAKLALAAAHVVNSSGAEYRGLDCGTSSDGTLSVRVKIRAAPGFQLDRVKLSDALRRYILRTTRVDLHVSVELPL